MELDVFVEPLPPDSPRTRRLWCDEALDELFEGVFAKRYRDSKPEVRAAVVRGLVGWVRARPSKFAATKYLKYAAWVLDFQDGAAVRASGARVLAAAFSSSIFFSSSVKIFTNRGAPSVF